MVRFDFAGQQAARAVLMPPRPMQRDFCREIGDCDPPMPLAVSRSLSLKALRPLSMPSSRGVKRYAAQPIVR
jgi:hypothetical protein